MKIFMLKIRYRKKRKIALSITKKNRKQFFAKRYSSKKVKK